MRDRWDGHIREWRPADDSGGRPPIKWETSEQAD